MSINEQKKYNPALGFLPGLLGSFAKPAAENPTVAIMEAAFRHHGLPEPKRWVGAASIVPSRTRWKLSSISTSLGNPPVSSVPSIR